MVVCSAFDRAFAADGAVSRMIEEDLSEEEMELGIERDDGHGSGLTTPDPDQAFVQHHLRFVFSIF